MTKDLALLVGPDQAFLTTEEFLAALDENLAVQAIGLRPTQRRRLRLGPLRPARWPGPLAPGLTSTECPVAATRLRLSPCL